MFVLSLKSSKADREEVLRRERKRQLLHLGWLPEPDTGSTYSSHEDVAVRARPFACLLLAWNITGRMRHSLFPFLFSGA